MCVVLPRALVTVHHNGAKAIPLAASERQASGFGRGSKEWFST